MRIRPDQYPVIVRFQYVNEKSTIKPGTPRVYSNMVNEATGEQVGNGPFEEVRVEPGDEYTLDDAHTKLISIDVVYPTGPTPVDESPNGPGSE